VGRTGRGVFFFSEGRHTRDGDLLLLVGWMGGGELVLRQDEGAKGAASKKTFGKVFERLDEVNHRHVLSRGPSRCRCANRGGAVAD